MIIGPQAPSTTTAHKSDSHCQVDTGLTSQRGRSWNTMQSWSQTEPGISMKSCGTWLFKRVCVAASCLGRFVQWIFWAAKIIPQRNRISEDISYVQHHQWVYHLIQHQTLQSCSIRSQFKNNRNKWTPIYIIYISDKDMCNPSSRIWFLCQPGIWAMDADDDCLLELLLTYNCPVTGQKRVAGCPNDSTESAKKSKFLFCNPVWIESNANDLELQSAGIHT